MHSPAVQGICIQSCKREPAWPHPQISSRIECQCRPTAMNQTRHCCACKPALQLCQQVIMTAHLAAVCTAVVLERASPTTPQDTQAGTLVCCPAITQMPVKKLQLSGGGSHRLAMQARTHCVQIQQPNTLPRHMIHQTAQDVLYQLRRWR
jgi:hypothetical protein